MGPDDATNESVLEPIPSAAEAAGTETPGLTFEQLSAAFGPYAPPSDFDHGPEFEGDIPRPIPRQLRRGSFQRRRRGLAILYAVLGSCFMLVANWTIVQNLAFHVLPLQYLGWIGAGMIGISLCLVLRNWISKQRFRYVTVGTPFVGRVLHVGEHLTTTINAETKAQQVEVQSRIAVEYDNPETHAHEYAYVISEEKWPIAKNDKYEVLVSPGDYVTLVGMPEQIQETVNLYGFLGLDPSREFLLYKGKPITGVSPFTAILISMAVFACLWLFMGVMYVLTGCFPLEWNWPIGLGFIAGGVILTTSVGWWLANRESPSANALSPLVAFLCFGIFGVIGGLLGLCLVNSVFDSTEPTYAPITIVNHWQKTHKFIFREYEIEYTEPGQPKTEKAHVTRDNLMRLGASKLAAKEIRQGALGLKWVRSYHPCVWVPVPKDEAPKDPEHAVEVDFPKWIKSEMMKLGLSIDPEQIMPELKDNPKRYLIPVLVREDGSHAPVPESLIPAAKQELAMQMNQQ